MSIPKEVEPILERLYAGALTSDAASELGRQLQAVLEAALEDSAAELSAHDEQTPVPNPVAMPMPDNHNA